MIIQITEAQSQIISHLKRKEALARNDYNTAISMVLASEGIMKANLKRIAKDHIEIDDATIEKLKSNG